MVILVISCNSLLQYAMRSASRRFGHSWSGLGKMPRSRVREEAPYYLWYLHNNMKGILRCGLIKVVMRVIPWHPPLQNKIIMSAPTRSGYNR